MTTLAARAYSFFCYAYHFRQGRIALERMYAIMELFSTAYDAAHRACPSINRYRLAGRRHSRIARLYRRRMQALDSR